ncbi:MAG: peptidylprolyl isomerase [Cyanothece sp. SIO2G6]|nr:peptidylprolyl isomerase [Cyanothece sp. SIO2G6]
MDSLQTRDQHILKVNDDLIGIIQSLRYLRISGKLSVFLSEIIQNHILHQELEHFVEPTGIEIEQVSMEARLQQQLVNPDQFQQWLIANNITYDDFRNQIIYRLKADKLKKQIAAPKLQETFEQQKQQLDRAVLSRIVVDSPELAQSLKIEAEAGADFTQLAKQHSVVDDAVVGGVMGPVSYGQMPPIIREAIGNAQTGQIVGPVEIDQRYCLLKVEKILPATLDESLTKQLENKIFEQWLAEKVQSAKIELNVDL